MGIVPDYAFDFFISYAHVNDQRIAVEDEGWITDLHKTLHSKLWEEMLAEPRIWRDQGGLDGRALDEGIQEALHTSAVLLVVLSRAYLGSRYCRAELAEYSGYLHPAFPLVVRGFKRIVVVQYDEEPRDDWPEVLRDAPCVSFCEGRRRFTKPRRSDPDPYWERVDAVVRHLSAILGEMRRGRASGPEVARATPAPGDALPVYLAEATDDLLTERGEVAAMLERGCRRLGVEVFPRQSIVEALSVRQACREGLTSARTSIHLVNETSGRVWGDAGKPLARIELEESLQRTEVPRPLVWMPPGVEPKNARDPGHRVFLEQLRSGTLPGEGSIRTPELFEVPLDQFLVQLEQRLFPPPKAAWRELKAQRGGALVYVLYNSAGQDRVSKLVGWLREHRYAVSELDHSGDPQTVGKRHEANLRFCDAAVVVYGCEGLDWAEYVAQEGWSLSRQKNRPKRVALLNVCETGTRPFGFQDDLILPLAGTPTGNIEGLPEFLASIEGGAA
jgi:hypothetical protein